MPSGKSSYLAGAILNGILGGPQFALPSTVYLALSTAVWSANATGSAMSEIAGGSYSRVAITNNAVNWPNAMPKVNGAIFTFPAATAAWGNAKSFYLLDAAANGRALYGGDLMTARDILTGDTASFAQGALIIQEA